MNQTYPIVKLENCKIARIRTKKENCFQSVLLACWRLTILSDAVGAPGLFNRFPRLTKMVLLTKQQCSFWDLV